LTLKEIQLINDARIIRDNNLYQYEKESERESKRKGRGKSNFTKAEPNESAPQGSKKGGALGAEQALRAFQSGVWSKK
jgi:hypothetical protein